MKKGAILSCSKRGRTIATMMCHHPYYKLDSLTDSWYTGTMMYMGNILHGFICWMLHPQHGTSLESSGNFLGGGYDWRRQGGKSLNLFDFQSYSLSASCLLLCEYFPPLPLSHYCEVLPNHCPKTNGVKDSS